LGDGGVSRCCGDESLHRVRRREDESGSELNRDRGAAQRLRVAAVRSSFGLLQNTR
jgi:hypothetical protein